MADLSLRTKFLGGFVALLTMVAALGFTSMRAMSSLNNGLYRVAHRVSARAEKTSQLVETVTELSGHQQALLLRSVLSDAAGVEQNRRAVTEAEHRIDGIFAELGALLDTRADRQLVEDLHTKTLAVRPVSAQVAQLIQQQQMIDALKLVGERLLPAYDGLQRDAETFLAGQREKMNAETVGVLAASSSARALAFVFLGLTALATILIVTWLRQINNALSSVGTQVSEGALQVARAALQMGSVSGSLAQGASEQAATLEQTSGSAEQVNALVQRNAESSRQAANHTNDSNRLLIEANQKLEQMLVSMRDIYSSSEKISKIIRVIDEIAFQTNILSLNAAVEAARAGEAGMGFAVVADEVRNLAQRCSQAAKDTSGLIEESIQHSRTGKVRLDEVAASMRQVTESAVQVQRLAGEVNAGSQEQARSILQISRSIQQVQQVTQQNAASAEEGASAGAQMSAEAEHLQDAVRRMREMLGLRQHEDTAGGADHARPGQYNPVEEFDNEPVWR